MKYIGARYIPIYSTWNNGVWDQTHQYEQLEIVINNGNYYISGTIVPPGVDITNTKYWHYNGSFNPDLADINKKYNNDFYYSDNAYKVNVMFFPNTLTIAPQSVSFAEMIIKVCKESNKENNNSANTVSKKSAGKIRKWVVMKIQKSNICYSMFIDGVVKEEKN